MTSTHQKRLLFLFLFLRIGILSAQNERFEIALISFNEGLNDRTAIGMIKDQRGFIWVATQESEIYRYDGHEFLNLYDIFSAAPLFSANYMEKIAYSQNKMLIFYSDNPYVMDVFDPVTGEIMSYSLKHDLLDFQYFEGINMQQDDSGLVYLHYHFKKGENYIFKLQEDYTLKLIVSTPQGNIIKNPENSRLIVPDFPENDGTFWVQHEEIILSHYDQDLNLINTFALDTFLLSEQHKVEVIFLLEDSSGKIWISYYFHGGPSSIKIYDPKKETFISHPLLSKYGYVYEIIEIDKGLFLFAILEGGNKNTYLYDEKNNWIEKLNGFLVGEQLNRKVGFLKVANDAFLVAVQAGILRLRIKKRTLQHYLAKGREHTEQSNISTRGITGDTLGNIYFATEELGWYHLNKKENTPLKAIGPRVINNYKSQAPIYSRNIFIDEQANLWGSTYYTIGSKGQIFKGMLVSWNTQTGITNTYVYPLRINNTFLTSSGILVANEKVGGFSLFNKKTKEFTRFINADTSSFFNNAVISTVVEKEDGTFWVGTDKGLFLVDFLNATAQLIEVTKQTRSYLGKEPIFYVHQDDDQTLWIGTDGAGLKHYNPKNGTIEVFNETNGLCNNKVVGILPDDNSHFWISTFNGLAYFDKENEDFSNYFIGEGITSNEFNRTSFYKDEQGIYYFGGMNGINVFETKDLIDTTTLFNTNISSLTTWNKQIEQPQTLLNVPAHLKAISLPPENRLLKIKLSTTDVSDPEKNHYKYFLEGFHEHWQYLKSGNEIVFNYLPTGQYTLYIKSSNSQGIWSKKAIQLAVKVPEHFYKSIWFFLIIAVLVTAAFYSIFLKYRLNQVLKLQSMRTQISSDLHDEVGSSLTHLSMIMRSVDMEEIPERGKAYLQKGNELLMEAIIKIRDVVWAIDSSNDQTGNLVDRMMDFAFDMLNAQNINYEFDADKINRTEELPPLIRQNIYLIYKEAIQNIVKHSKADQVKIVFQEIEGHLSLMIKNNGLRKETKRVKGSGFSNMKLRAKRIGATIDIQQAEGWFTIHLNSVR